MSRDLDERKERTMKWCTYSGNGCYKYPRQYASDCLDCPYFKECIPVEPERVKGKCTIPGHQRCTGTPGCEFCNTCYWWHPAPSPGLLQRMGMATWDWLEEPKQLYICDHVDGCKRKGCAHRIAHRCGVLSHACRHAGTSGKCVPVESVDTARCIPYQEERDWFVACKDEDGVTTSQSWDSAKAFSSHLVSKSDALARVRNYTVFLRAPHRAFRWQDGLR